MTATLYKKVGRRYVEVKPYTGLNESVLITGGIRYALGRASYSPGCVMDFCRENWGVVSKNTRHVAMRDILDWLGDRHSWTKPGEFDSAWPDQWRDFLKWCFAQDKDEAAEVSKACMWQRDRLQGVDEFFAVLA